MQVLAVVVDERWRGIVHAEIDLEFASQVIGQFDREVVVVGHLAGGDHFAADSYDHVGPDGVERRLESVQSQHVASESRHAPV